jgi:hypothetical protein
MTAREAAIALGVILAVFAQSACHDELPGAGAAEPTTAECPTGGDRSCHSTEDCGPNLHCTGGHCYSNVVGCPCSTDDGDCGAKAHCTRGQCYSNEAGVPCATNKQCGPRAHCTVDTCYPNVAGSPCTEGSDCGPSSKCVSGRCN